MCACELLRHRAAGERALHLCSKRIYKAANHCKVWLRMPVGYTALKTVASMDTAATKTASGSKRRGHAAGKHGRCACCRPLGKLCSKFCHLSSLTRCLIIAVVALFIVTGFLWIGGAFLTGPASSNLRADQLCYTQSHDGGSGDSEGKEGGRDDPTVVLIRQNVYAWYLANTGIIVTLTIFSSCVCCLSYVGLCCDLPRRAKILGTIGIAIVIIMFSIFTVWMAGGVYLITTFDKLALFTSTCRNLLAYVVLLGMYFVTVCVVGVVWWVWRVREARRRARTTPRQKVHRTRTQLL